MPEIAVHPDVKAVIAFMQDALPTGRLVGVAEAVAVMAPVLWGHHTQEAIVPAALVTDGQPALADATE
jgi:hypothetical protein